MTGSALRCFDLATRRTRAGRAPPRLTKARAGVTVEIVPATLAVTVTVALPVALAVARRAPQTRAAAAALALVIRRTSDQILQSRLRPLAEGAQKIVPL